MEVILIDQIILEVGLEWMIDLNQEDDFIGKEALSETYPQLPSPSTTIVHPPVTAPPAASPQVTKEQNDPYIPSRRRLCTCVDSAGRSVSRGRGCRRGPVPFRSKQASTRRFEQ